MCGVDGVGVCVRDVWVVARARAPCSYTVTVSVSWELRRLYSHLSGRSSEVFNSHTVRL